MSTEINKKFKSSKGTALDYDDRTLGVARISKLMENIHQYQNQLMALFL